MIPLRAIILVICETILDRLTEGIVEALVVELALSIEICLRLGTAATIEPLLGTSAPLY